jgi:hypothetical protein
LGFGSPSEGRRVFLKAVRMGDLKAAGLLMMSLVPGIARRRVWVSAWRPASVQRAEGMPFWSVETFEVDPKQLKTAEGANGGSMETASEDPRPVGSVD